ncbi:putative set and mynd domain protein [Rosellinia necatrix]|uniref:Putative set and mynd domain protein n=1 Tax=Rosellinia necatrix TaxID=77044 RepID=A0A1W2THS4_ROSNE|nr:putative set and mynd domain protein [Rosellinia necatrix]
MSANADVEVSQSHIRGAGKGLFARRAFSPGDKVVSVDRPLVAELEIGRTLDTCAWCCQRGATDPRERAMAASMGLPHGLIEIKSCTACQRVGYCSKSCQSKAWKREHKHECKIIGVEGRPDLPPEVRGVVKILGRLKADPKNEMGRVREILDLWPAGSPSGMDEIATLDKQKYESFQLLGQAAWHYCGQPKIDTLDPQSIPAGLLSNILSNAFTLSSPLDNVHLGIGFDPLICSANHSYDPNACLVFNQPRQEIRALRVIKAGEEILIKYTEVTEPFSVRQAGLKESHFFTCECTKCKKGVSPAENQFLERPEDLASDYRKLADKLVRRHELGLSKFLMPGGNVEAQKRIAAIQAEAYEVLNNEQANIEEVREAVRMCIGSKMWRWSRQPVPSLTRRIFALSLESGAIYQTFRVGVKLHFEILPALYPQEFYPDRLVNAWVVSTVINVLCGAAHQELYQELAQGGLDLRLIYFGFLFYVYDHMPRMFGFDSPFGKVIKSTYEQIMAGVSTPEAEIREKIRVIWPSLETLAHNVTALDL